VIWISSQVRKIKSPMLKRSDSARCEKRNLATGQGGVDGVTPDYGIYGVVDQELFQSGGRGIAMFSGGGAPPNVRQSETGKGMFFRAITRLAKLSVRAIVIQII
jgi:hypothetical protein